MLASISEEDESKNEKLNNITDIKLMSQKNMRCLTSHSKVKNNSKQVCCSFHLKKKMTESVSQILFVNHI